jgi:hypothetical protein
MAQAFRVLPFLILVAVSAGSFGAPETEKFGCQATKEFTPLARLYSELEGDDEARKIYREMKRVKRLACLGSFRLNDTIVYPSGGTATLYAGREGATWNWSNGRFITLYTHRNGATWYWPNGQAITMYAYRPDSTWYWPNGRVITYYAGKKGASYYSPEGRTIVSSGPDLRNARGELDLVPFLEILEGLSAEVDVPGPIVE